MYLIALSSLRSIFLAMRPSLSNDLISPAKRVGNSSMCGRVFLVGTTVGTKHTCVPVFNGGDAAVPSEQVVVKGLVIVAQGADHTKPSDNYTAWWGFVVAVG